MNKCQFSKTENITSSMVIASPESFCWGDCLSMSLVNDEVMDAIWGKGYINIRRIANAKLSTTGWEKYRPLIVEEIKAEIKARGEDYCTSNKTLVATLLSEAEDFKINIDEITDVEWLVAHKDWVDTQDIVCVTSHNCGKFTAEERTTLSKEFGTRLHIFN